VLAAALDCGVLVMLVERHAWSPVVAAIVSYLLGGILQYMLCAWWVFPAAPRNLGVGIVAFTLLSLGGLGITWATIAVCHDHLHVNYLAAKFAALGLAFTWNFLSRKYLLFVAGPEQAPNIEAALAYLEDCERETLPFAAIVSPRNDLSVERKGAEVPARAHALEHVEA